MGLLFAALISRFGSYVGLADMPNKRSSHIVPTSRSGGIGIWVAMILTGLFFTQYHIFAMLASIIGFVSLLDDFFSIQHKIRLVLHLVTSAIVISLFLGIPTSIVAMLLYSFWIILITGTTNFYNFMDGIDGIAGLTGFVGFGFMAVFSSFIVERLDIALISTALSASCLGFLPFNIPKARVFMGDVGSVLLGFTFASLLVNLSTSINEFLCIIMFLCMFYADALVTIFCRWKRGENLIMAHRSHLYQYMCNELRLPHWKVSFAYALAQFAFAFLALLAYKEGIICQIVVFVFFGTIFLLIYRSIMKIKPRSLLS